ncbi:hypothetical protein FHR32_000376 [Streptosporangium album]|uniref:Uncharacterized protein n=1 Tax=Streptosporangium album TaxID=47479 RepID=A0A7W7RR67_9ACTN|nr:hypothetical protein [Streptosporangium album]MBB4936071.1 hypothetical protein [Streptosporangium album]
MDGTIPADVVEQITAPVTDVRVDVLCNPSCPPVDPEPEPHAGLERVLE